MLLFALKLLQWFLISLEFINHHPSRIHNPSSYVAREKLFIFNVFLVFMKMSENYSKNNIFDHKKRVQKKFLKNSSISALVHFMHLSTWLMDRYFELFDGSVHGYDILWWWTSSIMLVVAYMVSLTLCATNWLKSATKWRERKFLWILNTFFQASLGHITKHYGKKINHIFYLNYIPFPLTLHFVLKFLNFFYSIALFINTCGLVLGIYACDHNWNLMMILKHFFFVH